MRKINFRKTLAVLFLILIYSPSLIYAHAGLEDSDEELGGMAGMGSLTGNAILEQAEGASKYDSVIIYYNEACSMCWDYIKHEFVPALEKLGVKNIVKKDYVSEPQHRVELNELNKKYQIPSTLQGHFVALVGTETEPHKIILGGHVPLPIVVDLLTKGGKDGGSDEEYNFEHLLVLQDEMDDAKSYFAWGFKGDAKEYPIDAPISDYLSWFNANQAQLSSPSGAYEKSWSFSTLLPLIIATGFLDGINPCAFAVLLLFIAFLYTLHKTRTSVWKMGLVYVSAIFLAYFLIGLGLIKAFLFIGYPHLIAKIGAYLMILLGIINIIGFLLPADKAAKFKLGIPAFTKDYLKQWLHRATLPAAFVSGFLVGLCTFPCSGGMYVAIVGLLAAKTTYLSGLGYLIIYNLMFVVPLLIILVAASNKHAVEKLSQWEQSQSKIMKLVIGLVMILLGLAIVFWFM